MIHVCYGLYDRYGRYSKFVGVSMLSLFEKTNSEVTVHILHDNTLSEENKNKFETLAARHNRQIKFYNVEILYAEKVSEFRRQLARILDTNFSIGTLYRLLIPHVFSDLEKIIYLDADILLNLDLEELWQIELSDKPLAAVAESEIVTDYKKMGAETFLMREGLVEVEDYFNAGVLLLNLPKLSECADLLAEGINFVVEHPQCTWFDQDILNYCFSKNYLRLPKKFDTFVNHERDAKKSQEILPAIYHYIGNSLNFDMKDNFNRLWMEYFFRTPWFGAEVMTRIFDCVQELHVQSQEKLREISAKISGKRRIFFLELGNFEVFKKIFLVDKSEEIIDATKPDARKILLKRMKKLHGAGFFILLVRDYQAIKNFLSAENFVEGKDFMDAMEFLSRDQGKAPIDTYFLIRAI